MRCRRELPAGSDAAGRRVEGTYMHLPSIDRLIADDFCR
jgi:hypothetical protein